MAPPSYHASSNGKDAKSAAAGGRTTFTAADEPSHSTAAIGPKSFEVIHLPRSSSTPERAAGRLAAATGQVDQLGPYGVADAGVSRGRWERPCLKRMQTSSPMPIRPRQ